MDEKKVLQLALQSQLLSQEQVLQAIKIMEVSRLQGNTLRLDQVLQKLGLTLQQVNMLKKK